MIMKRDPSVAAELELLWMIVPTMVFDTVAFIRGLRQWTVRGHGVRTEWAAAMVRVARLYTLFAVLALQVGTCLVMLNGTPCSLLLVALLLVKVQLLAGSSCPLLVGRIAKERMLSRFRRCLLVVASLRIVIITWSGARVLSSGVPQRAVTAGRLAMRILWNCSTAMRL